MNEQEERNKRLGESYRQSTRETLVIIGAWAFFMAWTAIACSLGWKEGEEVETLFGLPRWVFFGVILPWIAACGFTWWFTMCFMKDTDLNPDSEGEGEPEDGA